MVGKGNIVYFTNIKIIIKNFHSTSRKVIIPSKAMEVVQLVGKENFMNVLEKFHIYKETYTNSQTIKLRWDTIHSSQL